ncbi:copper homeostasis periplasmic binding protein CopC [Sodalis sp. RH20]|uniref:copper homeostasis periplasmic binding protein CopC n=1 Tax=unclassified Sodalis (in: enterobacteria) TaxID=2636512 RepID=UPI0039B6C10E
MNRTTQFRSLIVGACLATGLLITSVAQAHISLVKSTPTANAVVTTPQQIDLVFSEQLVLRASRLELSVISDGGVKEKVEHINVDLINDGKTLRATPHHPLGAGVYRVQWRAVGDDNHPMTGEYSFTIR